VILAKCSSTKGRPRHRINRNEQGRMNELPWSDPTLGSGCTLAAASSDLLKVLRALGRKAAERHEGNVGML
jgi:hypothetical protein